MQTVIATFHLERWGFYMYSVCDAFANSRMPASVGKELNCRPITSGSTETLIVATIFQMAHKL